MRYNNIFYIIIFIFFNNLNSVTILPLCDSKAALDFVKKYLPANPTIVEAGAFDGTDSILMSRLLGGTIHAFEPVPIIFDWLTEKTKNYSNIFRYKLALSDQNGFSNFYISEDPNFPNIPTLSSSLLIPKEHLNLCSHIFKQKILVETITLDKWSEVNKVSNIDLLWLDLQGYELNVLKKSKNILKNIKVILTEAEFVEAYQGQPLYSELKEWLESNGFKLIAQDVAQPSKEHWCFNLVFINKLFY